MGTERVVIHGTNKNKDQKPKPQVPRSFRPHHMRRGSYYLPLVNLEVIIPMNLVPIKCLPLLDGLGTDACFGISMHRKTPNNP